MIMSPFKYSVKMSPHEGAGDLEQEGTEAVNGIKLGRGRRDKW
jgi:hypothetical protein